MDLAHRLQNLTGDQLSHRTAITELLINKWGEKNVFKKFVIFPSLNNAIFSQSSAMSPTIYKQLLTYTEIKAHQ